MPGLARRLARRYVPPGVRTAIVAARDGRRAGTTASKTRKQGAGASQMSAQGPGATEHDPVVEALRTGRPLTDSLVAQVRSLLASGEPHTASSIAASLRKEPETSALGALTSAVVAFHRGFPALAWSEFAEVSPALRWRHAASEYVRSGIRTDRATVLDDVRRLIVEDSQRLVSVDAGNWTDILAAVYGAGDEDLARAVFAVLDREVGDGTGVDEVLVVNRDWIRPWVAASADSRSAPEVPAGHVSFAIMDYGHPGRSRASANIGDHVQSIASLGHLVRHQDLSFHGPQDLVDLLDQLHGRVRPEMQRTGISTDVDVMTVDRDASMYREVPPDTWMLGFGWFMHAIFELRYGFPFHRNLRPIFVSFHCNKRDLLTPEAKDYLRECGPIGCRDWTTVDILLSVDVPAFFSGCLTTTINTVFPDLVGAFPAAAPIAYVDAPDDAPPGAVTYKHSSDAVRFRTFTGNMFEAVDLLDTYRRDHSAIVTSRLHCYLPLRSIGAQVDFRPKNRSDIRFAGLIDINDDQFEAIRSGINNRLEKVFAAIMNGGSRDEVYGLWRELCADDVELARERRAAPAAIAPATDVSDEIQRAIAGRRARGTTSPADAVDVAIRVDESQSRPLNVLVESLVRHVSRPLRIWLLDSTEEGVDLDEVALRAEGSTLTAIPTRGLGVNLRGLTSAARNRSRSGFEVLMLPALLPDVDRVVLLPLSALVEADVAALADIDLAGQALAAPDVAGNTAASGFGVIHSAGNRLSTRTTVATELRRRAHARHTFDFTAFDTDVLVMDLERLRAEDVVAGAVQLVEEFGLTAREVLHFHVGPARASLPRAWHVVPTRTHADTPALLHWLDEAKPWTRDYAPEQERWIERRRLMRQRLAAT